jgi:hypothetical protein
VGASARLPQCQATPETIADAPREGISMTADKTYDTTIRSYDHDRIAALPAYAALRQALSDIGNEAAESGGIVLGEFLDALCDMAVTAPFGDICNRCCHECWRDHGHGEREIPGTWLPSICGADRIWWPHAAVRKGEYVTGTYRCERGHIWTCSYAISIIGM